MASASDPPLFHVRPIAAADQPQWRPLWDGYNAFYGRSGPTALAADVTRSTWARFLSAAEPVRALVAEQAGQLVGLAHYLFHRSTTRLGDVCYLNDLYTAEHLRGRGVGRALVEAVYAAAGVAGCSRVYWHTHATNEAGRRLYDTLADNAGFIVYAHEL